MNDYGDYSLQWYDNVIVTKVTVNLKYHVIAVYRVIEISILRNMWITVAIIVH